MVVLLNIQGKCAHLRAKTVDISGHLPDIKQLVEPLDRYGTLRCERHF